MIIAKSQNISLARIYEGMSMRELARKAGVNIGTISKIESGPNTVTPRTAKAVSLSLGKSIDDLFTVAFEEVTVHE